MQTDVESPGSKVETVDVSALTCLSSMATRRLLADFAAVHEARTGQPVRLTSVGGVDAARMVRAGEPVDVVVLAKPVMATLEAEGLLAPGGCVDIARSPTVVAVQSGADRPDLSSEASVRTALSNTRRIAYSTGPSGDHLIGLLTRWGILGDLADRLVKAPPGVPVGALLADGTASLGLQQFSELMDLPGVEIVGALPPGIEATTIFTAGVAAASARAAPSREFVSFIASADMRDRCRRHGMGAA